MAPALPPVTFRLPAGWHPVPPERTAASGVDFAAVRPVEAGFTPSITVGLSALSADETVDQVAEAAVARLRESELDVVVRRRAPIGDPPTAGVAQEVLFVTSVETVPVPVTQLQVLIAAEEIAVEDVTASERRVLYVATLTAASHQVERLAPDFQAFVRSLRPGAGDGPSGEA